MTFIVDFVILWTTIFSLFHRRHKTFGTVVKTFERFKHFRKTVDKADLKIILTKQLENMNIYLNGNFLSIYIRDHYIAYTRVGPAVVTSKWS